MSFRLSSGEMLTKEIMANPGGKPPQSERKRMETPRDASIHPDMRFLRHYRFVLSFLMLLVFCSVMVIRGLQARQSKHVEMREAMILLQSRGYTNQAARIYDRLITDTKELGNKILLEDFQRTVLPPRIHCGQIERQTI